MRFFDSHSASIPISRGSADLALRCRRPRIICADGESLHNERGSFGPELMRHGFAEWAGIQHVEHIADVAADGHLSPQVQVALRAAAIGSDVQAEFPIVLCRDPAVPALLADESVAAMLVLVGQPPDAQDQHMERAMAWFRSPVPVLGNVEPGSIVWLGGPDALLDRPHDTQPALLTPQRALGPDSTNAYLEAVRRLAVRRQTPQLLVVFHVDRLRVGRHGHEFMDDEVLAATLGWLQQQAFNPTLILLSSHRVSAEVQPAFGELARHLGHAL